MAAELERRVLTGELAPNTRLPTETELCDLLGVSRSVVRDSIQSLSARGLIEVRQGFGMVVAAPSQAAFEKAMTALLMRSEFTIGDVVDAREMLESALAPLAARTSTTEDWSKMERSLSAVGAAIERKDWATAVEEHVAFHTTILEALHVPALALVLRPVHQLILLSSVPPKLNDPALWELQAHHPILKGLKSRNASAVAAAMRHHFEHYQSRIYTQFRALRFRDAPSVREVLKRVTSRTLTRSGSEDEIPSMLSSGRSNRIQK